MRRWQTSVLAEEPEPELGAVLEFMRLVWALDAGLRTASKRMEQHLGITGPQRLVLRVLGLRPDLTAGALATVLHVHPSTLTGILRRLQAKKLIVRRVDPGDGRRARLRLSPQGEALNTVQAGTVEDAVRSAIAGSRPEVVEAAGRMLGKMAEELASIEWPRTTRPSRRRAG